jgi:hypothetical protein
MCTHRWCKGEEIRTRIAKRCIRRLVFHLCFGSHVVGEIHLLGLAKASKMRSASKLMFGVLDKSIVTLLRIRNILWSVSALMQYMIG